MKKKTVLAIALLAVILVAVGIIFVKKKNDEALAASKAKVEGSASIDLQSADEFVPDKWLKSGVPVLLEFGASWCPPCKIQHPILEKVAKEYKGKVIIKYIDVDKFQSIAVNYPVQALPTQVLFTSEGKPLPLTEALMRKYYSLNSYSRHGDPTPVYTANTGLLPEGQLVDLLKHMGMKE